MTNPQKQGFSLEDQLADFTDRILNADAFEQDESIFAPGPELQALERLALRLKAAFAETEPDGVVIRQMRNNILEKWKQQGAHASDTTWHNLTSRLSAPKQRWTSRQSRARFAIMASLATLVIFLLLAIPSLNISGTGLSGASGQNSSTYVLIALAGLILLAVWLYRRKS